MTKRFVIPFATSGDKSVTPDATDPAGAISYSQGWPVAYQLADTDPNYRPVGRQEMNGVLFDVTGALAEIQSLGAPEWVAVTGLVTPYAINAVLRHNGFVWRNTVPNNSVEPGTDNTWVVNVADETLATAGAAPAFTLTPTPAIPAYGTYQRFRVQFNATPVGTPTLNVSTRGAKNLKQYNAAGEKVAAVIVLGMISDVVYDGTDFVVLDSLPPASAVDPWLTQPIGVPIPVFDNLVGVSVPPTTSTYRYIKLSAGDPYNAGVLSFESVTGTAPLVQALATISLAGSPMNGQVVDLMNTSRRVIRGGSAGVAENDAFQSHWHDYWYADGGRTTGSSLTDGLNAPATLKDTRGATFARVRDAITDGVNGTPRVANETRTKNIGATYYMRVK